MFYIRRNKISVDHSRNTGIVFDCALQNKARRVATVVFHEYELWFTSQVQSGPAELLSRLSFDLTSQLTNTAAYRTDESRPLKLIWPFSPHQLQRIEDLRQDREPTFEIRSRLIIQSQLFKTDGISLQEPQFNEESAYDSETNQCPICFKINYVQWGQILEDLGFKHIILHELSIPTFPPAFGRAEHHLTDAWRHHRAGREDSALMSCYKAFECLGFNITGAQISRADVIAHLMSAQEEAKRKSLEAFWETVTSFCHLGRHDRSAPVRLTHVDGELAVVSATVLLKYLANRQP